MKSVDRDTSGRFRPGHSSPGPGNPRLIHLGAMQAAVRDAIGPKELAEVLHRLRDLAVGGDVAAARVLLDRVMGRARVEESAAALIELPSIETAGGCSEALSRILKAASVGEIDSTAAAQLAGLVDLARRSIETLALEERIDALEDRLSGA